MSLLKDNLTYVYRSVACLSLFSPEKDVKWYMFLPTLLLYPVLFSIAHSIICTKKLRKFTLRSMKDIYIHTLIVITMFLLFNFCFLWLIIGMSSDYGHVRYLYTFLYQTITLPLFLMVNSFIEGHISILGTVYSAMSTVFVINNLRNGDMNPSFTGRRMVIYSILLFLVNGLYARIHLIAYTVNDVNVGDMKDEVDANFV